MTIDTLIIATAITFWAIVITACGCAFYLIAKDTKKQ